MRRLACLLPNRSLFLGLFLVTCLEKLYKNAPILLQSHKRTFHDKLVEQILIFRMAQGKAFKPRQRIKQMLSNNPNTVRTRKYEQSRSGLDAALHKINQNERQQRCRVQKAVAKSSDWANLSNERRQQRLELAYAKIDEKYEAQRAQRTREWAGDDSDNSSESNREDNDVDAMEEEEEDTDNEKSPADASGFESDGSNSEFDGADDEAEVEGEYGEVGADGT